MTTSKTVSTTLRTTATAATLMLLLAFRADATDIADTPLKVFTFAGVSTADAMHDKDHARVIRRYRSFGSSFGVQDLVNVCAAHLFKREYRRARRVCSKAVNYRSSVAPRRSRRDVWAAHANYAVAKALEGDYNAARRAIAKAERVGGDHAYQASLDHNLVAIEQLAAPDTRISSTPISSTPISSND